MTTQRQPQWLTDLLRRLKSQQRDVGRGVERITPSSSILERPTLETTIRQPRREPIEEPDLDSIFGRRQQVEQPIDQGDPFGEDPLGILEREPISPVSDVVTAPFSPELAEREQDDPETREWWQFWEDKPIRNLKVPQGFNPPEELFGVTLTPRERELLTPRGILRSSAFAIGMTNLGVGQLPRILEPIWRLALRRNLRSWAKSTGTKIPKGTEASFVNTGAQQIPEPLLAKETIRTLFRPTKKGFTLTKEGARVMEDAAQASVQRFIPQLAGGVTPRPVVPSTVVPLASQTQGIAQLGGVTPEQVPTPTTGAEVVVPESAIESTDAFIDALAAERELERGVDVGVAELAVRAELEEAKFFLETDEVAQLRFRVGQRSVGKGERQRVVTRSVSIDQLIDRKENEFAFNDSFTPAQAKAIRPEATFSEANKLPNGRIRSDAVLDRLAGEHTDGDVQAFIDKVNQIIQTKNRIKELGVQPLADGIEGMAPTSLEQVPQPTPPVEAPVVATQQVRNVQEQGRTAPESIPPPQAREAHVELAAPDAPQPPIPPTGVSTRTPDDILGEIASKATPGERPDQTLLRLHEAAIGSAQTQTGRFIKSGGNKLKAQGVGVWKRDHLVPLPKDIATLDELFTALHNPSGVAAGEVQVPAGYEEIYQDLRGLTDWDTASMIDFSPEMATVEDYFFRGWKPPTGATADVQQGRPLVRTPGFAKHRVGASYQEMRDAGFEPLFWNPYEQWGLRHMMGIKYREQMKLVDYLKGMGEELIRPHDGGSIPVGWRVPEVGPAFEGKPFATTDPITNEPTVMFTRRFIVDDRVANTLENIYGKKPNLGKFLVGGKTIDPLSIVDWLTFVPKQAKLFLSFFQQVDFLTRSGAGGWTRFVDALLEGQPIEAVKALAQYPQSAIKILKANVSPTARQSLKQQLDSTEPIVKDRPGINLKGISEAGLSTRDVTIFPADMDKLVSQVATEAGVLSKLGSAIGDLESAMRRGLFDGVYPAAIITDIQNNIAPMAAHMYRGLNDAQINGIIAKIANIKYSTIPASQSVIQNRWLREVLRRAFFSVGESEGLLRQATGAFKGPQASFWRKHFIGVYLFLMTTAAIIHFASTGKPLPLERYTPISKDNWGPLPFGYNTKFAAPTLPFRGRGDAEITLDLVGQMDTALRLLNPINFTSSRTSVPVRAIMNQASGTDFYGAPIDDVGPGGVVSRTMQLLLDLFAPIGLGGIGAELARLIPGAEAVIPRGESRLGLGGLAIQATGLNLRAEQTLDMLDRFAKEGGFLKADGTAVERWSDLEPNQKKELSQDETLKTELGLRSEAAVERQIGSAAGFQRLEEIDSERLTRGEALVSEFFTDKKANPGDTFRIAETFRDEVTLLKREISRAKQEVDEAYQLFKDTGEVPEDPNERALTQYYSTFDSAKKESGVIDWDLQEAIEKAFREQLWTPEQQDYIDRNVGLTEWGPLMQEFIDVKEVLAPYWELPVEPRSARQKYRKDHPEVDKALIDWYGYGTATGRSRGTPFIR